MAENTDSRKRKADEMEDSHKATLEAKLENFTYLETLAEEEDGKYLAIKGTINDPSKLEDPPATAVVKLRHQPPSAAALLESVPTLQLRLASESGAEYAFYSGRAAPGSPAAVPSSYRVEVICPASERQVERARQVATALVVETPATYTSVTRPYIHQILAQESSLSWLYNVLEKKKEVDRIVAEDPDPVNGFLVSIDTKWNSHPDTEKVPREEWKGHASTRDLYLLGMCLRRDLPSLRSLRGEHLPLLRALLRAGREAATRVYGVGPDQVRAFVHYPPQFYHFHVHFVHVDSKKYPMSPEKNHSLPDIIENLEADHDFYTKRSIICHMKLTDALLIKIKDEKGQQKEDC